MRTSRGRGRRVVRIVLLTAGAIAFASESVGAPVDEWVLGKIEKDENVLLSAAARTDGRDIRLLEQSTTYVPFFLEGPELSGEHGENDAGLMSGLFERQKSTFLAGGYLYRIGFGNDSLLHGLSGGDWNGSTWYSSDLEKEIEINPLKVWSGRDGSDFSYASILSGVPPRLVVFDRNGELKEERNFDVSDPNLSSKIEAVAKSYSRSGEPTVEMVSLAEYLRNDEPLWRKVEITSSFNFRNQQERPEEMERLSEVGKLTRAEAMSELQSRANGLAGKPDRKVEIEAENSQEPNGGRSSIKSNPDVDTEGVEAENEASRWPVIVVAIALLAILALLIRAFLRRRSS